MNEKRQPVSIRKLLVGTAAGIVVIMRQYDRPLPKRIMLQTNRVLHLILLFLVATLSGCLAGNSAPEVQPRLNSLVTLSPFVTLTETTTPFPSATPIPSTATPTSSPTLTPTWTPPPTLEPEQAQEILKTWLQGLGGCLAPCFWNITPGQTTLDEAMNNFNHLGVQMELTNERDGKAFYEIIYKFESGLSVSPLFTIQDEIVRNIEVDIHPEKPQGPEVPREWLAYSPETLISQYGLPSQVDFFIGRNRDNDASSSIWYDMVLYFETADLIVLYNGSPMQQPTSLLHICPTGDSFALVRLYLGENPEHPPQEGVALEEAASMTIEEFAALMKGDNENACFDLNQDLFP